MRSQRAHVEHGAYGKHSTNVSLLADYCAAYWVIPFYILLLVTVAPTMSRNCTPPGTLKLYPGLGLILPESKVRNSNGFKGYRSEGNQAGKSRSESKRLRARYLCEPISAPGFQSQNFPDPFPIRYRSNEVERNSWGWVIGTLGHSQEAWLYFSILPSLLCSICIHEAFGQA